MAMETKNLEDYSKDEVIELLRALEEKFNLKNERLKLATTKLQRARTEMKSQKEHLQKYRKQIVRLTYPHGHNL